GWTPLHAAVRTKHLEVVRFLLGAGADKNAPDNDGHTPLHIAAIHGHPEVVRALLEAGADITAKNK
ncbi:ankyrin repeat-containing domain protein, partial [Baffinella frigidus]